MRTSKWLAVSVLALSLAGLATARQLAMLVEVAPRGVVDEGTLTEITVRIAPEDRTALTEDVMLWVELSREEARVLRRGWALKIDDSDKPITVEIVIPDGPHVLRVDLKGAGSRSTGVWWGDVDVSGSSPSPEPASVPASDPDPDDSDSEQRRQSGAVTAAAAAAAAESDPDPDPAPDYSDSEQWQQSGAVAATAVAAAAESDPSPEPGPAVLAASGPIPRPDPSSPGWEITVVATRGGVGVADLEPSRLEISVGGEPTGIASVDGPGSPSMLLGIAVDLSGTSSGDLSWIAAMVERLAGRALDGGGMAFVADTGGRVDGWGIPADRVAAAVGAAGGDATLDLPELIRSSLDRFSRRSGRAFLLVVTDGRDPKGGKTWAEVHRSAAESGVPILVAGIWNDDFASGLRKDLRKLGAASGGSVFYAQGPTQSGNLIDRFGALFDGAYAVGLEAGPAAPATAVKVRPVDTDAEIRAATAVRMVGSRFARIDDGRLRGRFTYMADAAIFEPCRSGEKLPVSMEADYLAAERAYLESRPEPGSPVLMTVEGRIEPRPPMEGDGMVDMFVIDRFVAVHPGEECGESPAVSR